MAHTCVSTPKMLVCMKFIFLEECTLWRGGEEGVKQHYVAADHALATQLSTGYPGASAAASHAVLTTHTWGRYCHHNSQVRKQA